MNIFRHFADVVFMIDPPTMKLASEESGGKSTSIFTNSEALWIFNFNRVFRATRAAKGM
jgi:hypothetical protein